MTRYLLALLICLLPAVGSAQTNPAAQAARVWRQQHERAIVDEFVALLSIPNIARDRENIQRNADVIVVMMEKRASRRDWCRFPGAIRSCSARSAHRELLAPSPSMRTTTAPLDPKEWASPPFEPTLRDAG